MRKYCFILLLVASLFRPHISNAQTNIQFFYDFGSDRQHFTATIEGFYSDDWGSSFFFVDHDFNAVNENSLTYSPIISVNRRNHDAIPSIIIVIS